MIRDVTDLDVYNLSLENLEQLYKLAKQLPSNHKRLRLQVTEAAEKIAPQIAEGFGKKRSAKEFCRFLSMALGSSDEVTTHIREIKIVAKSFTSISTDECDILIERYKILSKKINKLQSVWLKYDR
jgi:four helix bundle protein